VSSHLRNLKKVNDQVIYSLKKALKYIYYSCTTEIVFPAFFNRFIARSPNGKKYDCFYFLNELDLLEIRLNILDNYVDYFVIIESSTTFVGKNKEMLFAKNRERYKEFLHKIIYYEIPWSPKNMNEVSQILEDPNTSPELKEVARRTMVTENIPRDLPNSQWITEYFQKESLLIPLKDLKPFDTVFVSDLDEIWNPKIDLPLSMSKIFVFKQIPYIYFLNNRSNEFWHEWTGSIVTKYSTLKKCGVNESRTHNRLRRFVIRNGGWHFSFQGGPAVVRQKLEAYSHLEFTTNKIQDKIPEMIEQLEHIKGKKIRFYKDNKDLPNYLIANKKRYNHMFL
jgi:beta-1,4-mannosyl-glycoprotein beta-1,4-N-acetylglucosaminyltransferase